MKKREHLGNGPPFSMYQESLVAHLLLTFFLLYFKEEEEKRKLKNPGRLFDFFMSKFCPFQMERTQRAASKEKELNSKFSTFPPK
jgi:hypothetical protein